MFVEKNLDFARILRISGLHVVLITIWNILVYSVYEFLEIHWFGVPWFPITVIGTAVAFYIGFKNNSSYDRMWEARKLWGAIVNSSRAWGGYVKSMVTASDQSNQELHHIHRKLIYRHIAWLYALRSQLLVIARWEHANQKGIIGKKARGYRKNYGVGYINDTFTKEELRLFLPAEEHDKIMAFKNPATQIIDQQMQDLSELHQKKYVNDFQQVSMQKILYDFYNHQGGAERIKKFPMPRQYGAMSLIFVAIFILLLPFGMVAEFHKLGPHVAWISIPVTVLVSWVYLTMEMVGDFSENPFQGLGNDVPMKSICRAIEIDLREMLGETDLPDPIKAENGVLM